MKRDYRIFSNGELKRKDNTLHFITDDGIKKDIPVNDVDSFYIFGEMRFNTKLINFLSQNGILIHFFNYYGFYTGSFYPRETLNSGMLLVEQTKHYLDNNKRLEIAKKILIASTDNILHNLKYYAKRKDESLNEDINKILDYRNLLENSSNISELMGIEGNIRKIYYQTFNIIINQNINFTERVKHPPDNFINSLISFVNSLIYTTVLSEIYKTQLSPLISFLHEPGNMRYSLSLDLAEIFKPLIGDRMIFSLLNKNQITEKNFKKEINFLYLNDEGKKIILKEYDSRLATTVRHKDLGRNVSYRYLIRLECYKLIKHLIGEKEYIGFKIWW